MATATVSLTMLDEQNSQNISSKFDTQSIKLKFNKISVKLKSNYYVDNKLQEIDAVLMIKVNSSSNSTEVARTTIKDESMYDFYPSKNGNVLELSANTSYSISFSFYKKGTTTAANHFTYYSSTDNLSTKDFPIAQIKITSSSFHCCEMVFTYDPIWNFSSDGYPCPSNLRGNDLWYEFSEPKRWDLWKTDILVNDGYPYIFDFVARLRNIDIFRFDGETKQWVRVIPAYYDKQKNLRLLQVYKIKKE